MNEENQPVSSWLLPASILVAGILIAGSVIYSIGSKNISGQKQQADISAAANQSKTPEIGDDVILGDPNAPVTIFVFADYQCPFCGKLYKETEPLIRKNYIETGKANMVNKDLAFLGQESLRAAEASECAKEQGKYWAYHDALFDVETEEFATKGNNENTGNLNRETFSAIASSLQMNVNEFLSCLDSGKYEDEVKNDLNEAKDLLPRAVTPTVIINGEIIQGAQPYSVFAEAIDKALNISQH